MDSNVRAAKQQLVDDFSKVVADAEGLLRAVRDVPGEKADAVRASVEARISAAKDRLRYMQESALEKGKDAARAADNYAHDNPWPLIGAAALLGFVAGWIARDPD